MTEAILRRREAKPGRAAHRGRCRARRRARWRGRSSSRPLIIITAYLPLFAFQRDRGQAVLSDGLCGRLRAVRRAAVRADGGPGAGLSGLSPAAARLPQSGPGLARGGLSARRCAARCARPAIAYVLGAGAAVAVVVLGATVVARIPARARRGLDLAPRRACRPEFRCTRRPRWPPSCASAVQRVSRGVLRRHPYRPQRRRHRSVDALAHGGGRRASALQHLAGGRDQAGSDPAHGGAARRAAGLRDRIQPADHRQRARQGVRSAQRSSRSRSSATISTSCAASARTSSRVLERRFRASATPRIDQYTPLPQIAIKVDRAATARYGINVADVADLISTGIGGGAVSQVFIGERRYDMTVRFPAGDAQQPGGDQESGAHIERRRAHSAVAGRR